MVAETRKTRDEGHRSRGSVRERGALEPKWHRIVAHETLQTHVLRLGYVWLSVAISGFLAGWAFVATSGDQWLFGLGVWVVGWIDKNVKTNGTKQKP